jgi:hypothetical protein
MSQNAPTPASEPDTRKLISPLAHVAFLVLTAVFFACMYPVIYPHTPDFGDRGKMAVAAYTTLSITVIFWIVLNCFWVTLVDQRRRKKAGIAN